MVKDDEGNRKVMDLQLRKYYHLTLAKDGDEAMELFLHNDYQMILMDINLGAGINVTEVLKKIRETDKEKKIPLIAITAYASYGDSGVFRSKGFDDYFSKPSDSDDLLKCITSAINDF